MILQVGVPNVDVFSLIAHLPPVKSVLVTFEIIDAFKLFSTSAAVEIGMLYSHHAWK